MEQLVGRSGSGKRLVGVEKEEGERKREEKTKRTAKNFITFSST